MKYLEKFNPYLNKFKSLRVTDLINIGASSVLVLIFLFSLYFIYSKGEPAIPEPYDKWAKNYDRVWITLTGDQDTILKRKKFAEGFSKYFNAKYPRYSSEFIYKPVFDKKNDFLFFTLESLKKEKEILTNNIEEISQKSLFRDYKVLSSLDFLSNGSIPPSEPNLNAPVKFLDSNSEGPEYVYDTTSVWPKEFRKGDKVKIKYRVKNVGLDIWSRDKVFLFTANPDFGKSIYFKKDEWINNYTVGTISESEVKTGEIGTFEFNINSNLPVGKYDKQFFTLGIGEINSSSFKKLNGNQLYYIANIYPEFNEIKKDLNGLKDFGTFLNRVTKIDEKEKLDSDDIRKILRSDILKFEILEKEKKASLITDDSGYLVSKNEETLVFSVKSKYGLKNLSELNSLVNTVEYELTKVVLPEDVQVMTLGILKQIDILFPGNFAFISSLILLLIISSILTYLISRFLLPTIIFYLSLFIGFISAIGVFLTLFGSLSSNVQLLSLIILCPIIFIATLVYFKIIDFKVLQNSRELIHIIEVTNNKYRFNFFLYFCSYLILAAPILIFFRDIFYLQIFIIIVLNCLFSFVAIFYLFPIVISLISKTELNGFFRLKSYLDFSFVQELLNTPFRFSATVLVLFLLLYGLVFTRVNFIRYSSGFNFDSNTQHEEEVLNLKFGLNLLYPISTTVTNFEALKALDSDLLSSKYFRSFDNALLHIPNNQEEKIGLVQSYLKDFDYKNLINKNNEASLNSINVFKENMRDSLRTLDELIIMNQEADLYGEKRDIENLEKSKKEIQTILEILDDEKMITKVSQVEKDINLYIKNIYESKLNYLNVTKPITVLDFSAADKTKYLKANSFVEYIYSFGSLFDSKTRELIKTEFERLGYEINEKDIFVDSFKFLPWQIFLVFFLLLLFPILISLYVLKKHIRRIILLVSLNIIYLIFTNTIFNLFAYSFEYFTFASFIIPYVILNIFAVSSLASSEGNDYIENPKVTFRALISAVISLILFCLVFLLTFKNIEINKLLLFLTCLVFTLFVFYPITYGIIFNFKSLTIRKTKIRSLNQVDSMVESSPHFFPSKQFFKEFSFYSFKNYLNEYFRKYQIKKVNLDTDSGKSTITEGQQKLVDMFKFSRLKRIFLNKFKVTEPVFHPEEAVEPAAVTRTETETETNLPNQSLESELTIPTAEVPNEGANVINNYFKDRKRKEKRFIEKADVEMDDNYDFGFSKYIPIHVFETETELTVEAEIGDINIYDVDVFLDKNILRIKSSEVYKKTPFERHIAIHVDILPEKISVNVDQGELIISIPKTGNKTSDLENEQQPESTQETAKMEQETKVNDESQQVSKSELIQNAAVISEQDIRDEKKNLLQEIMGDDNISTTNTNNISNNQPTHHAKVNFTKIDHELKSLDKEMTLIIFLKDFHPDDLSLSLANKLVKIRNSDKFLGEPFLLEIPLEKSIIYETIKTEVGNNELVITAKYRPDFVEVSKIEDQGQN